MVKSASVACLGLLAAACTSSSPLPGSSAQPTVSSAATASASANARASASGATVPAPSRSASASASSSAAPPAQSRAEYAPPPPLDTPRAFDMHCDTPWQISQGRDLSLPKGHITETTLREGHVGGVFFAIYISDKLHPDDKKVGHPTIADAERIFNSVDQIVQHHPSILTWALTDPVPDDHVAAFASIEGAGAFAADITAIDRFIKRGVRLVGPVHMKSDKLASSATDPDQKWGLTELGKKFCTRVYTDGALVDVSHMSDAGFRDVAEIAKSFHAPIVATHSNARAVADVPRNLTDDELRAIADSDGVVGINFYDKYVRKSGKPGIDDVVKQALYMVKVAGIDHVGIGSDFDGSDPTDGVNDASYFPKFADALIAAGLSREDVQKIFSENVKRVLRWKPVAPP